MLRSSDFILLPFPPDLTPAGIAVASRRLAYSRLTNESMPINQLRLDVAHACVELAFRRYLQERQVQFQNEETYPFSDPERITLALGGRRTDIETSLIAEREAVKRVMNDPGTLLSLPIQMPARLQPEDLRSGNDLTIFAFLAAGIHGKREELVRAAQNGEPFLCSHIMPEVWHHPNAKTSPGLLSLRYYGESPVAIELYGLDLQREPCVERLTLDPQTRVDSRAAYLSVSCMHASAIPTARVEIHSPVHRGAYTIMPLQWSNVWVYGQEIILAGYLPSEEIWAIARQASQRGIRTAAALELSAANLYSLPKLLEQVTARG
jgi:hypothetical protein